MENYRPRIAIIGGTGKVGRDVVQQALQANYLVRMLVRNPARLSISDEQLEVVEGDVREAGTITNLQGLRYRH